MDLFVNVKMWGIHIYQVYINVFTEHSHVFTSVIVQKALMMSITWTLYPFYFPQYFPQQIKSAKEEEGVPPEEEQHYSLPSCNCYSLRPQYCQGPWIGHYCQKRTTTPNWAQGGAKAQASRGQEDL